MCQSRRISYINSRLSSRKELRKEYQQEFEQLSICPQPMQEEIMEQMVNKGLKPEIQVKPTHEKLVRLRAIALAAVNMDKCLHASKLSGVHG